MAGTGRSATISLTEDPFGPGDPVELARLVRRALAAAGRKAVEVSALVVVTDTDPGAAAVARFTRRALGPHGGTIQPSVVVVEPDVPHEERLAMAQHRHPEAESVVITIALGPDTTATASCWSLDAAR
jgi:hypothetical protein